MAGQLTRASFARLLGGAARRCDTERDRGSLVMAMLLMMVGVMFAALLVPVVLNNIRTSRSDTNSNQELDAAQAGVDVALGQIRAANNGSGTGVLATLPCNTFTGSVANAGAARYSATIYYFASDPAKSPGGTDAAVSNKNLQIGCVNAGSGLPITPNYAVVVSQGTNTATGSFDSVPTRTVLATYVFKTSNTNIPGGLIHSYASNPDLCLDAGSSSPTVGTVITLQKCASGTAQQLWAFNTNLTMSLAATGTGTGLGLCLDAAFPHVSGESITLQNCPSATAPDQQWGFNGNNNFFTVNSSSKADGFCWNPQSTNTVGASLVLGGCGSRDTAHAFQPEASVGAGNADSSLNFEVNYNQFGRCLDITNGNVLSSYLIAYPCKVTPESGSSGSANNNNQRWTTPTIPVGSSSATGPIGTFANSSYCLTSPMRLGGYPTMTPCVLPVPTNQTWTVWGATSEYATSYRITDASTPTAGSSIGYCLQPTDPTLTPADVNDLGGGITVSKIIVTTCSASTLQKWDAPAGIEAVPVKDYHER